MMTVLVFIGCAMRTETMIEANSYGVKHTSPVRMARPMCLHLALA